MNTYDPPGGLPWGLFALTGGSLFLNAIFIANWALSPAAPEVADVSAPVAVVENVEAPPAAAVEAPAAGEQLVAAEGIEAEVEEIPVEAAPKPFPGVKQIELTVHHSLARTFRDGVPGDGDVLSAQVARLFVWDLDLRRDLRAGDKIEVAWTGQGEDIVIEAARYRSQKHGTFEAFRFKRPGDDNASWWTSDGTEVARSLVNSPIRDYEQITSLLKDRPRHRGMDFKTDIGTPVVAPKSGRVTRVNWNTRNNGGCVEVKLSDGTLARYLHLSEATVKAGQSVGAGEPVGLSGNTGHSTAPHLHYELEKSGKIVDPVDYHGVSRRNLDAGDPSFLDAVARLRASFGDV